MKSILLVLVLTCTATIHFSKPDMALVPHTSTEELAQKEHSASTAKELALVEKEEAHGTPAVAIAAVATFVGMMAKIGSIIWQQTPAYKAMIMEQFVNDVSKRDPNSNFVAVANGMGLYWGYCNHVKKNWDLIAPPPGASCCMQHWGDGGYTNWGYYGTWRRYNNPSHVQLCIGSFGRPIYVGGLCLDVNGQNNDDGTRVIVWHCNGGWNQNWKWVGQTLVNDGGKCLDRSGGGTWNGNAVQIWTCHGGSAQRWVATSAHRLKAPHDNSKCLDVTGNVRPGNPLEMWSCNGGANQNFTF